MKTSHTYLEIMGNFESSTTDTLDSARSAALSRREQEIFSYVVKGQTSKQIADRLFISYRTVEKHRDNIMQKLKVRNTAGLVRFAMTHPNGLGAFFY